MANQNATYTIVLATFNNYFTRKVRNIRDLAGTSYTDVVNYLVTNVIPYQAIDGINFKYKDGVNTRLVSLEVPNQAYSADMFNYVFVFGSDKVLKHCWFIMEAMLDSGTKHTFTLKRDLVVDYFSDIKTLPVFVQKGLLQDNDPMIYNKEGMSFNQIKISQTLLKERNQDTPWIVLYLNSSFSENKTITANPYSNRYVDIDQFNIHFIDSTNPTAGAKFYNLNKPLEVCACSNQDRMMMASTLRHWYHAEMNYIWDVDGFKYISTFTTSNYVGLDNNKQFTKLSEGVFASEAMRKKYGKKISKYESSINNGLNILFASGEEKEISLVSGDQFFDLLNLRDKIVYSSSLNKYFKVTDLNFLKTHKKEKTLTANGNTAALRNAVRMACEEACEEAGTTFNEKGEPYKTIITYDEYVLNIIEVDAEGEIKTTLFNTRNRLSDAPYDMVCIPFSEINIQLTQNLIRELSTNVYDAQIVPYCPARFMMIDGIISRTGQTEDRDYSKIYNYSGGEWVDSGTEIIYCQKSSDNINIDYEFIPEDIKVQNETILMRLVSSNHSSAFEFSPIKNNGIDGFIVTYSYKPYTPYIHVKPVFKGLYGSTFPGDSRGITFVGDFSIDMISDKWADFQVQNKNYQATFNNEIQTMDKMNQISLAEGIVGSQLNAAAAGVAVGGMTGNAIAGIGAGVASGVAGAVDVGLGQEKYRLNKQLKISQFEYQLGNIKALPRTISKVTAYCIDNLYFPYVEVYDATDVEKQALRDKINYDGMTVMRIGTIEEFLGGRSDYDLNFFKAEMITLPYDMTGDYHEVNELALMLEKGVYL